MNGRIVWVDLGGHLVPSFVAGGRMERRPANANHRPAVNSNETEPCRA